MECKKSLAKSMFWRILFTVICVTLLICSLSLPASAAVLDYNDYVTNVKVDGDNDIVTVSFPLDSMRISLIEIGVGEVASVVGSSLSVVVSADTRYVVRCYPLGDSISLSNIPSDTVCSLSLSIDSRSWGYIDVTNAYSSFGFAYYGKSGNFLDLIWGGLNHDNEWDMTASEVLTPVPDAFSFLPMGDFCDFSFWEGRTVDIGVYYFTMTMTISSLYRLQQQSGKTNEILTEVEKQLADQGKTLDEVLDAQKDTNNKLDSIINGSSEQQNAADRFKDDIGSASDSLDAAGDALNQVPKPNISAGSLVPNDVLSGNDYLVYVASIQEFWKSDVLSAVTLILGSMILISYVLFGEKG